ncbi:MAG: Fe-S cluster assembly protein SufD [Alphaproteobacteria bacterium]
MSRPRPSPEGVKPDAGEPIGARYAKTFAADRASLPGQGVAWLAARREAGLAHFLETGFPTAKVEEWKFANPGRLAQGTYRPAVGAVEVPPRLLALEPGAEGPFIAVVNGRVRADLSTIGALPAGVTILSLDDAIRRLPDVVESHFGKPDDWVEKRLSGRTDKRPHALLALNAAFCAGGVVVHVARGAAVGHPIRIRYIGIGHAEPSMVTPRSIIALDPNAEAAVIEEFVGTGAVWTNAVTEIAVGDGARLAHLRIQDDARTATHVGSTRVKAGRDARYHGFVLAQGADMARNEIRVALAGTGAECTLDGLYLGRGGQVLDNWTVVDHRVAQGTTRETYKGVLDQAARGNFQGRIRVWPEAVKSDARQLTRVILLSPLAEAKSKPELEILADDVKCSHGATVGDLDAAAMFFLQARGLDPAAARRLLVDAFTADVTQSIENGALRAVADAARERWLAGFDQAPLDPVTA